MPNLGAGELILCCGIATVVFFGPLSALVLILLGRARCPACHARIPKRSRACPRCRRDLPEGWSV